MRSYRKFLGGVGDTLLEVLRTAENDGWHHEGGDRGASYSQLVELLDEVTERARFYIDAKTTGEARIERLIRSAQDDLDRLVDQHRLRGAGNENRELDVHPDDRGTRREHGHEADL